MENAMELLEKIPKLVEARDWEGLTELLTAEEREIKVEAARALGKLERSAAIPALVEAMGDEEVPVRRSAARALAQIGQPAIPALVATLEGQGGRLAPYALWALGEIGSPAAVDELAEAARSIEWRVRWSAIEALGDVGGVRAIQALIQALEDRDERVANAAVEALVKIGELAVEPLGLALRRSGKEGKELARAALAQINNPAAQETLRREQLFLWIPVIAIGVGTLLVLLWIASMFLA